jgi:hypothetical protein
LDKINQKVPFGYEPPKDQPKGTLIYYDSFEQASDEDLDAAVQIASVRKFARIVLYPLHEETMKRMSKIPISAYYKREKRLYDWNRRRGLSNVEVDSWEGKRKKYTPIEAALRHLTETLPGPYFVYMTPELANIFASFADFEQWIVKIRLILSSEPAVIHPRLELYRSRWDAVGNMGDDR